MNAKPPLRNPVTIKRTAGKKTGKMRLTFEVEFPTEPGEAQTRAFASIGRLLRVALPEPKQRQELLRKVEEARASFFRDKFPS